MEFKLFCGRPFWSIHFSEIISWQISERFAMQIYSAHDCAVSSKRSATPPPPPSLSQITCLASCSTTTTTVHRKFVLPLTKFAHYTYTCHTRVLYTCNSLALFTPTPRNTQYYILYGTVHMPTLPSMCNILYVYADNNKQTHRG